MPPADAELSAAPLVASAWPAGTERGFRVPPLIRRNTILLADSQVEATA